MWGLQCPYKSASRRDATLGIYAKNQSYFILERKELDIIQGEYKVFLSSGHSGALINIQSFVTIVNVNLPKAWKDSDWPSCKDLLKFSDIDIIEKGKDLVMDKTTKNEIQRVLNLKTANDIISTSTLALYYLEILSSIKMEYTLNTYDPHKNKQYILGKALQELHFCDCVMLKTGEKIIEDKIKDYMEALKEYQEHEHTLLESNHFVTSSWVL